MLSAATVDQLHDVTRGSPSARRRSSGFTVSLVETKKSARVKITPECGYDTDSVNRSPLGSLHLGDYFDATFVATNIIDTIEWTVVVDGSNVATIVATFVPAEETASLFDPPLRPGRRIAILRDERVICLCKTVESFPTRSEAKAFIKSHSHRFANVA